MKLFKLLTKKTALVLSLFTVLSFVAINQKAISKDITDKYQLLEIFAEVMTSVKNNYVNEISDEKLLKSAIKGMISDLDPHSAFLDEKDYKKLTETTSGEFAGVGMNVQQDKKTRFILVVSPIDDTPAYKAGMKAGDLIVEVDNIPTDTISFNEGVDMLRGKKGSKVHIKVLREGEPKIIDVTITRAIIKVPSIKAEVKGNNIGYLRITFFQGKTQEQLEKGFAKIKKETKGKVRGYILDLRNNPGGLLSTAISVSDTFLNQGEIVSTRGRDKDKSYRHNARQGDLADGLPVVVLINRGSASSSEIVAGALQDHKRALIVGENSFGKGSVQSIRQITPKMALKFTTARYYTPSGKSIQGLGIKPDIEIKYLTVEKEVSPAKYTEASLKGSIKNNQIKKKKENKKDKLDKNEKKIEEKSLNFTDYILARGLNILETLIIANKMHKEK